MVLPTRNEAANVAPLLGRLRSSLRGVPYELLFVDDSDDETRQLLQEEAARDPAILVHHRGPGERVGGLSTAVVLGLRRARGRTVCVMDADLQHPPETIPLMLERLQAGADLVVASRYLKGGSSSGLAGGLRRLASRLAGALARAVFAEARLSTDPLAGFFACRAALLEGIEFRPVGFKILLELLVCSPRLTLADVPLQFQARATGHSKASMGQGLLFLRHMGSLVRDVPGSARRWKFAFVGCSGLAIFLLLLELGGVVLGWPALAAWAPAFLGSVLWNFGWNLRLTFDDLRRERYPLQRYVSGTLTAGGAQLVLFLGLVGTDLPLVADGFLAAVGGMAVNGALSWQLARARRRAPATPVGLEQFLEQLRRTGHGQLAALLDPGGRVLAFRGQGELEASGWLRSLVAGAGAGGRAMLSTLPASSRAQARSSIELVSAMVIPLQLPGWGRGTLVLQRRSRRSLGQGDLEAVLRRLEGMLPRVGAAARTAATALGAELSGSRGPTAPAGGQSQGPGRAA